MSFTFQAALALLLASGGPGRSGIERSSGVKGPQSDPRIESVERLVGDVQRPYLWAPLALKLTSAAGFEGDLVVSSTSFGIRVVRRVRIPPGGSERVLLPALDPHEVKAGSTTLELPKELKLPDRVVLLDARIPYAGELVSNDKTLFRVIDVADLQELLSQGLLDACDFLLVKEGSGLSLGSARAWAVAPPSAEEARAMAEKSPGGQSVRLVDPDLWKLEPQGGWIPAKKDRAVLFATLFALASFAVLVYLGRRHAKWATAAVAGMAALGVLSFLLFFPRQQLWILEESCEIAPPEGPAMVVRLWFAGAGAPLSPRLEFPRVVKPVFSKFLDAEEPLTIRVEKHRCQVEGFQLPAGRSVCFAAVEGRAAAIRALDQATGTLYDAALRIGGSERGLGDLAPGRPVPRSLKGDSVPVRCEEERVWLRFLEGDGIFGRLERGTRVAGDVGSSDLADGRKAPPFFIQRWR